MAAAAAKDTTRHERDDNMTPRAKDTTTRPPRAMSGPTARAATPEPHHPQHPARVRVCWSVCFVWPAGRKWDGDGSAACRPPSYYAACLETAIKHYAGCGDRVLLSIHPLAAEHPRLSALLSSLVQHCGSDTLRVRMCDLSAPAFYPTAARIVPLLDGDDFAECMPVVVADVHDPLTQQELLLARLLARLGDRGNGKSLGLTVWAAEGNDLAYHCDSFSCCSRAARALPLRSAAPGLYHWHTDAGMLVSTAAFRRALRHGSAPAGVTTFRSFLDEFVGSYTYVRGSEEICLDLFLSQEACLPLCIEQGVAHVHPPWRPRNASGASKGSAGVVADPPPQYSRQRPSSCQALDLEREYRLRSSDDSGWLEWLDLEPVGGRSKRARTVA